ncbi:mersacidin/lichenicidin family type 2 lantibiotic [Glycomyces harbinensis]|uniref:Type 2 lantibiotic, mersacidin/lichenicidin family n=1 Tax=Glycomyces harbinensis TaxID=58114 RepID=A0A1G7DC77_9ACTN|nr:mersacidin/lichenicidin family type 2 lantibiotic [Glycomyces harbinensis]SDE49113.1 type 2 lantibiotic, mersacidin/lichenicidin family [Glycomyces harbinensis]
MDIVRSWKEPEYRRSLGDDAPEHPAGTELTEVSELSLTSVGGAAGTQHMGTFGCCWCLPWYSGWTVCGSLCSPKYVCD